VAAIGNFVHRTMTFASNFLGGVVEKKELGADERQVEARVMQQVAEADQAFQEVRLKDALRNVLQIAIIGNEYFQKNQPWALIKDDPEACRRVIYCCVNICRTLAVTMAPFLPGSSKKIAGLLDIEGALSWEGPLDFSLATVKMIAKPEILFKKIDDKEVARLKSTVTKSSDAAEFFKS